MGPKYRGTVALHRLSALRRAGHVGDAVSRGGSARWGGSGEEGACVTFPSSPGDSQNKAVHDGKVGRGRATRLRRGCWEGAEGGSSPESEKARTESHKPCSRGNNHRFSGSFGVARQRRHHSNRFRHREAAADYRRLATEAGHCTGRNDPEKKEEK